MGKNNWFYQQKRGTGFTNLIFRDPDWIGTGKCALSYFTMTPDTNNGVIRKWIAPHGGFIHIEGEVSARSGTVTWDPVVTFVDKIEANKIPANTGKAFRVNIYKNVSNLFSVNISDGGSPLPYDIYVKVKKEDSIYFLVE